MSAGDVGNRVVSEPRPGGRGDLLGALGELVGGPPTVASAPRVAPAIVGVAAPPDPATEGVGVASDMSA